MLATTRTTGAPHLTVMWYALDGDEVLFSTARGRIKVANLERDSRASLLVFDETKSSRYVSLTGRVRIAAEGISAYNDLLAVAARYGDVSESNRVLWKTQQRLTFRLTIERVLAQGF